MKTYKWIVVLVLIFGLALPVMAGNGRGGGGGGAGGGGTGGGSGTGGGDEGTGGGEIPDTGELYGDLYVILRDTQGVPMLDSNGCVQPISAVSATDPASGITAVANEPFLLWTYVDSEGDLVECELTETMTTWVQAVDFGRLNLGRAPDSVLEHSFDEAIKAMNAAIEIGIDPVGRLVLTFADGTVKTIDSPSENLSLYIKMMIDGHWITVDTEPSEHGGSPPDGMGPPEGDGPSTEPRPVLSATAISLLPAAYQTLGNATRTNVDLTNEQMLLAASLLAAAADKTGNITLDKVVYINSVFGINQTGTLPGEVEGKTYFDFTAYNYDRNVFAGRSSGDCATGWVWVLQPELDGSNMEVPNHFVTQCMDILGYESDPTLNAVHFTNMVESYTTVTDEYGNPLVYGFDDNVRGFAQAADDALQVLEYIHNYKVPEVLYP